MNAIVVYESHWGNTAAVARAVAEGIGPAARAVTTDQARTEDADLIVVGAPLMGFRLPTDKVIAQITTGPGKQAPDVSHATVDAWLDTLPAGKGYGAAFETALWWSPGSAKGAIARRLADAGYLPLARGQRFVVKGTYGPLRDGELEKARAWGAELARAAHV